MGGSSERAAPRSPHRGADTSPVTGDPGTTSALDRIRRRSSPPDEPMPGADALGWSLAATPTGALHEPLFAARARADDAVLLPLRRSPMTSERRLGLPWLGHSTAAQAQQDERQV